MKVSYWDYLKTLDVSVLVAETIFSELRKIFPLKTIKEIAETTSGGTPLRSNRDFYEGEIPWIKSGELNDGYLEMAEEYITQLGLKNSSAKIFPKGTLLLAMYGATVGKTGILSIDAATNQAVCAIFPKEIIRRDFLFWFFRQHRYRFIEQSKGGAQPNISQTVINETTLPLPDLVFQDRLIDLFTNIQKSKSLDIDKIPKEFREKVRLIFNTKSFASLLENEIESQQDFLKQLRQQLLQDAIQGKLVPQDPHNEHAGKLLERINAEKDSLMQQKKIRQGQLQNAERQEDLIFLIPNNWVWCKLDEICYNITDGTHQTPSYTVSGRVFLSAQNVKPFIFKPEDHKFVNESDYQDYIANRKPEIGDLLIGRVGAGIGEAAVIDKKIDFCFYVSLGLIQPFKKHLDSNYLACVINSPYGVKYSKGNISSKGGSAGNFNLGRIRSFLIPLPPLTEQHRIVEKIDRLMKHCDELEQSIRQNQEYTKELLQVALKEAFGRGG